ncbi:MAG: HD-GYP domain-containing protein [Lachnospiraceae bacterium]
MITVARMALKPGMELAQDAVSLSNGIVVPADTVLDDNTIKKLARFDIMAVSIKEPEDYATTHNEKIRLSRAFAHFKQEYDNNLNAYKYLIDSYIKDGTPINLDFLVTITNNILKCATTNEKLLDYLYNMLPSEDDMTYAHCLNSALIAKVFGTWLCLPRADIDTLVLCGYFYDIGKLKLPNKILWKPGKLSDFEFNWMKTHTQIGYDLLKPLHLNEHIMNATLMHHERCDGSGYPNHLPEHMIDSFAKYIAVVDSYEAMTSARSYRTSLNPFQVIANFERTGFDKYNTFIIQPILNHIALSQLGMTVKLSNDITGEILLINQDKLSRPLVKDSKNNIYDLAVMSDINILAIL